MKTSNQKDAVKKSSILIVDDSEDNRSYCQVIADMFNLEAIHAGSVDDAMAILSSGFVPEVVLLDLVMPGRRPEELVARVRGDSTLSKTKVVVMSALRKVSDKSKKMGADAAMHKPFSLNRFIRVVGL